MTPAGMKSQLASLFGREAIMGEFVRAMQTTFLVATAVLLVGALVALLIRNHVVPEPADVGATVHVNRRRAPGCLEHDGPGSGTARTVRSLWSRVPSGAPRSA